MYIYPYAVWLRYEPKASLEGKATPWPILKLASFGRPGEGGVDNDSNFVRSTYEILLWVARYMKLCCGSFGIMIRAGERYTYVLM